MYLIASLIIITCSFLILVLMDAHGFSVRQWFKDLFYKIETWVNKKKDDDWPGDKK